MAGIDPKLLDKHGNTAYKLAKENENEEFITAFLNYVDARKGLQDMVVVVWYDHQQEFQNEDALDHLVTSDDDYDVESLLHY